MLKQVTGQCTDHLIYDEQLKRYFHKDIYQDFFKLKAQASEHGIELYVLSSFRSFTDQLRIWNLKASGNKELLDDNAKALDFSKLSREEVLFAILKWSALPGTSRHHFGTDLDIVDKATWPQGYEVQLIAQEFDEGGHFYKLRKWFDNNQDKTFFRPYQQDQGGVSQEMWHLSHKEVSKELSEYFTLLKFNEFLDQQDPKEFLLLDLVKENSELIYKRYITNICT